MLRRGTVAGTQMVRHSLALPGASPQWALRCPVQVPGMVAGGGGEESKGGGKVGGRAGGREEEGREGGGQHWPPYNAVQSHLPTVAVNYPNCTQPRASEIGRICWVLACAEYYTARKRAESCYLSRCVGRFWGGQGPRALPAPTPFLLSTS